MSNFQNLKNEIANTIKANGNNDIDGALLQEKLLEMVDSLGKDYKFRGVATPDGEPITDDTNVFYVANTVGSYPYYGGLTVADGEIAFFTYNGRWSKAALEDVAKKSEIEKKITELESETNGLSGKTSVVVQLTQGVEHSSKSDQIYMNVPSGAKCQVRVVGITSMYEVYVVNKQGESESVGVMNLNSWNTFIAPFDIVAIGFYTAATETQQVSFEVIALNLPSMRDIVNGSRIFVGQDENIVDYYYDLEPYKHYNLNLSRNDWNTSNIQDRSVVKFLIREMGDDGSSVDLVRYGVDDKIAQTSFSFYAKPNNKYRIAFRGNTNEVVAYTLHPLVNSNIPLENCFTRGYLLFDNKKKSVSWQNNINIKKANTLITILPNEISYDNLTITDTSLYSLVVGLGQDSLVIKPSLNLTNEDSVVASFMISPNDNLVNRVVSTIPNQIINKENDYKKIFSNFLNYTGIAQESSSWDLYVFPILSPKIKVRTYIAGVGAENTSKLAWVMLDLPYELSDNYTEENIIRKSIIYGGSFIEEISNAKYVNHVVDVPKGALSIVVAVSKEASYIPRVEPCESNGLDKADLISDDINLAYPVGVWRDWNDMSANIISAYTKYTGKKPTIGFNSGNIYRSISYILGDTNFSLKSWRVPARKDRDIEISINVPIDSVLEIKDISLKMNDGANSIWQGGCKLTAHLGFQQFAPENSMIAFELAHRFNYPACVVNPIISKDGTIYCYHQGDASLSLDGETPIALTIEEFSSLTDEQISNYKVIGLGNVMGKFLEDIPTFESFVALCAKTGMRIVISTHPILTEQQWLNMKTITDKYNMTHLFTIKSFSLINLENAYTIFKDKIEGYIYDVGNIDYDSIITQVKNSSVGTEVRFGIEYPANIITKESVVNTMDVGYFVSAWDVYRISGERYEELIEWGVSEFTDDNNCCAGLNW